jgi:hypothetical protein
MKPKNPPAIAVWMLEHLTFADRSHALAGDLLEEFRAGRSPGWYWRQVLIAVAIGVGRQLGSHWPAVLFAALWALPSMAYQVFIVARWWAGSGFMAQTWHLAWPYSTICNIAFDIACGVLYAWVGLAVYFLFSALAMRRLDLRAFLRASRICLFVFLAASAGLFALVVMLPTPTAVNQIMGGVPIGRFIFPAHWREVVYRLNYFLAVLIPAWIALPAQEDQPVIETKP